MFGFRRKQRSLFRLPVPFATGSGRVDVEGRQQAGVVANDRARD